MEGLIEERGGGAMFGLGWLCKGVFLNFLHGNLCFGTC